MATQYPEDNRHEVDDLRKRNEELNIRKCANCMYWDTTGFGNYEKSEVGQCNLVARHWYPMQSDKMISLIGLSHVRPLAVDLIRVITRREFGCNQQKPSK